jgi:hypothetical protein
MDGWCPICGDYVEVLAEDVGCEPAENRWTVECSQCGGDVYHYDDDTEAVGEKITIDDVADYYASVDY